MTQVISTYKGPLHILTNKRNTQTYTAVTNTLHFTLIYVTATFTLDLILFNILGGEKEGGVRSRDRKVVGFITTYANSVYHH